MSQVKRQSKLAADEGQSECARGGELGASVDLLHPVLVTNGGVSATPLASAARGLTDRHRLGVLLQGAALLAHLRQAGLDLSEDCWQRAGLRDDHQLQVELGAVECLPRSHAERSAAGRLAQQRLRSLLLLLFGAERDIAGRGQARRIASRLSQDWQQTLTEIPARSCVRRLLGLADFLWNKPYAVHRGSLVASSASTGRVRLLGPREWRRGVLTRSSNAEEARRLAESKEALELWKPRARLAECTARELFARGHWRAAVHSWQRQPPQTHRERYEEAQAYFALGLFASALARFRKMDRLWPRMYCVACHWHLGEIYKAQRLLGTLDDAELPARELMALADVALRVVAAREDRARQRSWIALILRRARGRWRGVAHYWAAMGYLDMGDLERMRAHLDLAARHGVGEEFSWRLHHGLGVLHLVSHEPARGLERIQRALSFRRALRVFEAGRLWNDLGTARWMLGDQRGAERALEHSYRLLSRCEGPVAVSLCLSNLAEARMRSGKLGGVAALIERCQEHDRRQNNLRGLLLDRLLEARLRTSLGEFDAALEILAEVEAEERSGDLIVDPQQAISLRAEILALRGQTKAAAQCLDGVKQLSREWVASSEAPALWLLAGQKQQALLACDADATGRFWRAVAEERASSADLEVALDALEPYAAARLALFAFRLQPGLLSATRRRWAHEFLSGIGALSLAEYLMPPQSDGSAAETPPEAAVELDLWRCVRVLLRDPPRDEAALRHWFERLPWPGLGVELETAGRRMVLRGGRTEGTPLTLQLEHGTWSVHGGPPPVVSEVLLLAVERCCQRLLRTAPLGTASSVAEGETSFGEVHGIVGRSPQLIAALDQLERLSRGELPVLVLGETGSGKELAARALHASSPRRARRFLAINCAALSETLLLSDLFGHAKGAFTGADQQHLGVFESAEGGTVFLDEIGDLPAIAQGMLLRVLQEGEIRRLGESVMRRVDVRIVAATHRNLEEEVASGSFRRDLFYRLNVGTVTLPALRERSGDPRRLATAFLAREVESDSELHDRPLVFTPAALRAIEAHPWPGNVRQLRGAVQRAVALRDPGQREIDAAALGLEVTTPVLASWHEWLEELKRERLSRELQECGGNQARAARRLGITRQAMSYLVRQLKLS